MGGDEPLRRNRAAATPAASPNTASEKTSTTADLGIGCFSLVERYGCAGGTRGMFTISAALQP